MKLFKLALTMVLFLGTRAFAAETLLLTCNYHDSEELADYFAKVYITSEWQRMRPDVEENTKLIASARVSRRRYDERDPRSRSKNYTLSYNQSIAQKWPSRASGFVQYLIYLKKNKTSYGTLIIDAQRDRDRNIETVTKTTFVADPIQDVLDFEALRNLKCQFAE